MNSDSQPEKNSHTYPLTLTAEITQTLQFLQHFRGLNGETLHTLQG